MGDFRLFDPSRCSDDKMECLRSANTSPSTTRLQLAPVQQRGVSPFSYPTLTSTYHSTPNTTPQPPPAFLSTTASSNPNNTINIPALPNTLLATTHPLATSPSIQPPILPTRIRASSKSIRSQHSHVALLADRTTTRALRRPMAALLLP